MSLACCDGTSSIHPCQSNWKLAPELIPAALLSAENLGIYFASSRILAVTEIRLNETEAINSAFSRAYCDVFRFTRPPSLVTP
ncbi:Uncharacterized protein LW94_1538 [Fusarium fujikuroi]|nr:Uncharacterized protein Y057_8465 [Fusarium fujikuroi]KLP05075.1 Uncharacterized protein LW94_1538 [Fusarium fujikuroi]QGI71372.1 hypothetical protein CEK27_003701 [Fusarium fujikuroi]